MLARLAHFQYPEQARRQRGSTVEQLICNQRVAGSIPVAGSRSTRSPVPSRCRAFCCRAIETSSVADFLARCSCPPRRRSRFRHHRRRRATIGRSEASERTKPARRRRWCPKPARVSRRDGCAGDMRQLCRVKLSHVRHETVVPGETVSGGDRCKPRPARWAYRVRSNGQSTGHSRLELLNQLTKQQVSVYRYARARVFKQFG